tara:strand:+ start:3046 stop:4128 length:1083 start_codon:yes stop_codon:yes gene_type:complete
MRYRDTPEFVAVSSISTQFTFDAGATVGTDLKSSLPDIFHADGSVAASERPTITYMPLQDEQFAHRLLSPMSMETLLLLTRTGWSMERVLRLMVQNINGLDNATSAGGPTPQLRPDFESFRKVAGYFRTLQNRNQVEIAYQKSKTPKTLSGPIPVQQIAGADLVLAAEKGFRFDVNEEGTQVILTSPDQFLVLRVAPNIDKSSEGDVIFEELNIDPPGAKRNYYPLRLANEGQLFEGRETVKNQLWISTRSLLETLYYLSQGIDIPAGHYTDGIVTKTLNSDGSVFDWNELTGDLLRIHHSKQRPVQSSVAVQYREYWFFIDDSDLQSKSTFSLLMELYNLEIRGGGAVSAPVLTLGVGQ